MELRQIPLCISLLLTMTACERVSPASTSGEELVVGEHDKWQSGTHYEVFEPLAGVAGVNGKVTVVEFFWYGCPHCYTMDSHVSLWNRKKPSYVEFQRVPTTWGAHDRPHARLFYTLQALGRTDLHAIIFDTIHVQGNKLATIDEEQTLQLQVAFAEQHGIDPQQFVKAYRSTEVEERLRNAERMLKHFQVAKLPTLLVNGKYKTDVSRTDRRPEAFMRLIGDLAGVAGGAPATAAP